MGRGWGYMCPLADEETEHQRSYLPNIESPWYRSIWVKITKHASPSWFSFWTWLRLSANHHREGFNMGHISQGLRGKQTGSMPMRPPQGMLACGTLWAVPRCGLPLPDPARVTSRVHGILVSWDTNSHVCFSISVSVCLCVYMCGLVYVCICVPACACVYVHVCIYVCVCLCVCGGAMKRDE